MTHRGSMISISAALLLAACAPSGPASREDMMNVDTGTIVGEVSDPRNRARLHTELATLYFSQGNMGVALEEARIAASADPQYGPAHGVFGLVYMQLRENQLAEQSFERALKLAPNDSNINHNYGWFLCQTKREQTSIKYFLHAVRNPLYPTPHRSYSAAGECVMRINDFKGAEELFERALKLEPDDSTSLLQMGQIRYKQGKLDEARRLVARHNRVTSPSAESLWLALRVERKMGERVQETAFATQLRRRFPASQEYQQLQRGDFD